MCIRDRSCGCALAVGRRYVTFWFTPSLPSWDHLRAWLYHFSMPSQVVTCVTLPGMSQEGSLVCLAKHLWPDRHAGSPNKSSSRTQPAIAIHADTRALCCTHVQQRLWPSEDQRSRAPTLHQWKEVSGHLATNPGSTVSAHPQGSPTGHCLELSNVSPYGHPWLPGLGLAQGQQWSVVAFLDYPRGQQQSLLHPPAVWMCQVMHQELQLQQGWCVLHRSLQMWKEAVSTTTKHESILCTCVMWVHSWLIDLLIGQCSDLKHKI